MYANAQIATMADATFDNGFGVCSGGCCRDAKKRRTILFLECGMSDRRRSNVTGLAIVPASSEMIIRNRILSMLTESEYLRLHPDLEYVGLSASSVLCAPGDMVRHIYFPNDAVVSLLCDVDQHRKVEVAMEGNESAVGFAHHLGGMKSSNLSIVRDGGTAMRLEAGALRRCLDRCECLDELLHKSAQALVVQIVRSGVCNRFHNIEARVSRWLLMTGDRVGSHELHATHESIARMLGVRRSGVAEAAFGLRERCLISYRRGRIKILDAPGLRAASCFCYGAMKREYDSFLT